MGKTLCPLYQSARCEFNVCCHSDNLTETADTRCVELLVKAERVRDYSLKIGVSVWFELVVSIPGLEMASAVVEGVLAAGG